LAANVADKFAARVAIVMVYFGKFKIGKSRICDLIIRLVEKKFLPEDARVRRRRREAKAKRQEAAASEKEAGASIKEAEARKKRAEARIIEAEATEKEIGVVSKLSMLEAHWQVPHEVAMQWLSDVRDLEGKRRQEVGSQVDEFDAAVSEDAWVGRPQLGLFVEEPGGPDGGHAAPRYEARHESHLTK
jgi:hypothetical protein